MITISRGGGTQETSIAGSEKESWPKRVQNERRKWEDAETHLWEGPRECMKLVVEKLGVSLNKIQIGRTQGFFPLVESVKIVKFRNSGWSLGWGIT